MNSQVRDRPDKLPPSSSAPTEYEKVPKYPEHLKHMFYDWEKITEERKRKTDFEECERMKRLEIVSLRRKVGSF